MKANYNGITCSSKHDVISTNSTYSAMHNLYLNLLIGKAHQRITDGLYGTIHITLDKDVEFDSLHLKGWRGTPSQLSDRVSH